MLTSVVLSKKWRLQYVLNNKMESLHLGKYLRIVFILLSPPTTHTHRTSLLIRSSSHDSNVHALNVCAPSKFLRWNPNLQGFRRWGLWAVIRSWRRSPRDRNECFYKRGPRNITCPFCHMRLQQNDRHLKSQLSADTSMLILDLPAFRTVK